MEQLEQKANESTQKKNIKLKKICAWVEKYMEQHQNDKNSGKSVFHLYVFAFLSLLETRCFRKECKNSYHMLYAQISNVWVSFKLDKFSEWKNPYAAHADAGI